MFLDVVVNYENVSGCKLWRLGGTGATLTLTIILIIIAMIMIRN